MDVPRIASVLAQASPEPRQVDDERIGLRAVAGEVERQFAADDQLFEELGCDQLMFGGAALDSERDFERRDVAEMQIRAELEVTRADGSRLSRAIAFEVMREELPSDGASASLRPPRNSAEGGHAVIDLARSQQRRDVLEVHRRMEGGRVPSSASSSESARHWSADVHEIPGSSANRVRGRFVRARCCMRDEAARIRGRRRFEQDFVAARAVVSHRRRADQHLGRLPAHGSHQSARALHAAAHDSFARSRGPPLRHGFAR